MAYKYYNPKVSPNSTVSYKYIDGDSKGFSRNVNQACFSSITYGIIPTKAKKILVFQPYERIPYSQEIMVRWIEEITRLGFPVSISFGKTQAKFKIDLNDYKYKMHVSSGLQLIRCLYESHICKIPEQYFSMVEEKENLTIEEKFAILQIAHAKITDSASDLYNTPNTNHMITFKGNFKNPLTQKEFFSRLEVTKYSVHAGSHSNVHTLWQTKK